MEQSSRFICSAEYWCPCVPVGKPVSERTMDRHRKSINSLRSTLGLPILPRGRTHTDEREAQEFRRRLSMRPIQNPFSHLFSPMEIGSTLLGPEHANDGVEVSQDTGYATGLAPTPSLPDSMENDGLVNNTPDESNTALFEEPEELSKEADERVDDCVDIGNVSSAEGDNASDSGNSSESMENPDTGDSGEGGHVTDVNEGQRRRSHALIRFRSWARAEKEWVEMFVEFGVTDRLMKRILQLRKAPLAPITLKRNLIKYSGFATSLYRTCHGHMLIDKLLDDYESAGIATDFGCAVCTERGTTPTFSTFEYLQILPRLRSWVQNEDSCRLLYEYRHQQIRDREITEHDFGPGIFYSDVIDGELFRRIADQSGGLSSMEYDITLAISCDGFQTYSNNSYDCWPIVALNHNLHPSMRFLIDNIIPLGFIKGPVEPVRLDTFLTPLLEEVTEINSTGGTAITFFDGIERIVRVHIIVVTGDTPAVSKLAGLTGSNGKHSCRLCVHEGVYCSVSRHYYFPSKIRVCEDGRARPKWKHLYDLESPEMRSNESVTPILALLEDDQSLTLTQRKRIQRDTGIKRRTVTLQCPTVFAYESFPIDTMHLMMNVSKDIMEILIGENRTISRVCEGTEEFTISQIGLRTIDSEISTIAKGSAAAAFGNAPRVTSEYRKWKAVECKDFFKWYAVVLFDGHVSPTTLKGIRMLSAIFERCTWPTLFQQDVDDLKSLCAQFVKHFETLYFKYDKERVSVCKSTIHAILHLGRTVELCGPLVNVNQFWVERYIGAIKHRFHAKRLAAESLTENAKMKESYKMYYKEHFRIGEDIIGHNGAHGDFCISGVRLLSPVEQESLNDPFHVSKRTKTLLQEFFCKTEDMAEAEAQLVVSKASVWSHGRIQVQKDGTDVFFGAMKARRHRKNMKRADYYVSCEYLGSAENQFDVYYGRVLKILHVRYEANEELRDVPVILIEWAQRLRLTSHNQVYKKCSVKQAFGRPSLEKASVLCGSIAVLEHRIPGSNGSRTYFIDPAREVNFLLHPDRAAPDEKKRMLKGLSVVA